MSSQVGGHVLIHLKLLCSKGVFFIFIPASAAYEVRKFLGQRLKVKSELQLQAYAIAMATADLSHICDLHHRWWQRQILYPLSKARDQACILRETMLGP